MSESLLALRFSGASHHHAVICTGLRGLNGTRHGAPDRFDWGMTMQSLHASWQRHERLQAVADALTPEQLDALWQDTSDQARLLRRYVR